ncbi:MAG TPA: hypothetical protein ENK31_02530, partial [Nannocystis exedens]|nr:hypothetical protein [Nannocystis exedens]
MLMEETHRGEVDRGPDRLRLNREWWLDFDGAGLTVRDQISGELYGGSRLTMSAPAILGRVSAGGKDQFITHLGDSDRPGIEIRQQALNVLAESRVPMTRTLSAVDWQHDFHEVEGALHLPPGWRLLHAQGIDEVDDTWLRRWDLLEIFLVLVITIGIARLYGVIWGFFALFTLALSFPEWMAPRTIWLFVLAGEGLLRVLPKGRLRRVVSLYRVAMLVTLAGIVVVFSVQQLRGGLYPALEKTGSDDFGGFFFAMGGAGMQESVGAVDIVPASVQPKYEEMSEKDVTVMAVEPMPSMKAAPEELMDEDDDYGYAEGESAGGMAQRHRGSEGAMGSPSSRSSRIRQKKKLQEYDASTVIQTGPGVPAWRWRRLSLRWSGPVARDQQMRLFLLNPRANLALAFVRVAFMALLSLVVLGIFGGRRRRRIESKSQGAAVVSIALLLGLGSILSPRTASADEVPREQILNELRERLIETPACLPECAVIPRVVLRADDDLLRLVIEMHIASPIAVPLPGNASQWL